MFAKVFAQILDSSLAEDYKVRLVFEDMLKLADKDGMVDITRESISRRTNVPLDIVCHGIAELEKPDASSRSPDMSGRRIVRLDEHRDWGWRIVNFSKYRESATKEMLRMGEAERKREARRRKGFPPAPLSQKDPESDTEADMSRLRPDMSRTKSVLAHLNLKSGRSFRETETNLSFISSRLKEPGITIEGVKTMIDRQCERWMSDPKMCEYLRPETLFNKTKFDSYYAAKDQPIKQSGEPSNAITRVRDARNIGTLPPKNGDFREAHQRKLDRDKAQAQAEMAARPSENGTLPHPA